MKRKSAKRKSNKKKTRFKARVVKKSARRAGGVAGVEAQPLIAVKDVKASTRWYQELLGIKRLGVTVHSHFYQRLYCDDRLILQLHRWNDENHPNLVNPDAAPHGYGVLLWFEVDDFDGVVGRARALNAEIITEPHVNPAPRHREMWIRDDDGYVVVIASPDGESS